MEALCDLCKTVRAVMYCNSDAARLCFQCDYGVHSANSLSRRHPRSLLCDKCSYRPAVVRQVFDKMFLCESCDLSENDWSSGHERVEELSFYTGCPSSEEFLKILSPVRGEEDPIINPRFGPVNSLNVDENLGGDQNQRLGCVASRLNELASALSFLTEKDPNPFFPNGSNLTKDGSNVNNLGLHNGEGLSDNVALNFKDGFEMFSCIPPVQTKLPSEDGSLVMEKNLSVTKSNSHAENTNEVCF
ncbi:putative transcription factor interactor and regulator Znf-B family [Helianthus annuus]|nr:putative transcription factor interactor and regulator Znf-B family [Helianthus annuus]